VCIDVTSRVWLKEGNNDDDDDDDYDKTVLD